jgi:L-threonylcarbamoyladenylate synthase
MITNKINIAIEALNNGHVIGLPTETVYGLAANAFDIEAVLKIFQIKGRPMNNPLILHVPNVESLDLIATDIPEKARRLADAFWPGPLTLLLNKKEQIPAIVTAGHPTVAIRIPNHPVALEVLSKIPFPLAAPSANPFSRVSATTAAQVDKYFRDKIPVVLEGGSSQIGIESTIVGFQGEQVIVYRLGGIAIEQLEKVVGSVFVKNKNDQSPVAPGMLTKHYSPLTRLIVTDNIEAAIQEFQEFKIGLLLFQAKENFDSSYPQIELSEKGDLVEASTNLYRSMIELDEKGLDVIIAEKLPETGLGRSINDKLKRASS